MDRLLLFMFFIQICLSSPDKYAFVISCDDKIAELNHFWKSTGLCPPLPHQEDYKYLLSEDEKQNLVLIGSVPWGGIAQVRIHWLLDLVTIESISGSDITYNFGRLDQMVALLYDNGLQPGFELMGNPSNWFTDFENSTQVYAWRDLVHNVAKRYIDVYGLNYVREWNFETWNEIDHKDTDGLNFTIQGFLNYYDACSEGLRMADPSLILGGPAESFNDPTPKHPKKAWALLDHCANGINYFTKDKGVRLDYISMHRKGRGQSMTILTDELTKITEIQSKYPHFINTPFYNDEADPLVGWSKPEWWRADATYAAIVAKVIVQHQNGLLRQYPHINYRLLSNDNAFLNIHPSYFDQRTLVARFQMNETTPPSVQTVKKPVLSVMGLLALLGTQQVKVECTFPGNHLDENLIGEDVDVLATVNQPAKYGSSESSWEAAFLVHNSADTENTTSTDVVQLEITGVNGADSTGQLMYVTYLLDNTHGNPSAIWKQYGSPVYPTREQFNKMRGNQEPVRVAGPKPFTPPTMTFDLVLRKPGVSLIHVCAKPADGPQKVTGLRLFPMISSDVLVIWDDLNLTSRCILTYEVEFSISGTPATYKRVNDVDLIFTAYQHSPQLTKRAHRSSAESGWYRVRAVDYWHRAGPYSEQVHMKPS